MSTAPTPPPPAPRTPYCANSVLEPGEDCDFWNCKKENNLCIRKAPLLTEEGTFTAQEYNGSNSTESFPPRQDGWFQASCDNREGPACGGYLTKDQRLFVSTSTYGSMKIDPVKPGTFEPYARLDTLAPMVMSGDGRYVAAHALGELPSIHYFDMLTRTYKRLAVYGSLVSLAISHDGQTIAYGVRGGFYVIDLRAGTTTAVSTPLTLLRTNPDYTYMHRVSDDGQRIAYKEYESTHAGVTIAWFRVYDRTTGAHQTMPVSRDVGWPLFDAAARRMVYYVKPAEEKGTVWLYDFASGSNTAFLEGTPYNDGTLFCGRFSADGRICTLAGRGGAAVGTKIDVDTGQVIPH